MPLIRAAIRAAIKGPKKIPIDELEIGHQYYFKSIPYDRQMYKGTVTKKIENNGIVGEVIFDNVLVRNAFLKDPKFEPYISPITKKNSQMLHQVMSSTIYEYYIASKDEIMIKLQRRLLHEALEQHFRESPDPRYGEVGTLISSFCGLPSSTGGGKSRRRNRKSNRKTRSRK
jgi:hypothetical protein